MPSRSSSSSRTGSTRAGALLRRAGQCRHQVGDQQLQRRLRRLFPQLGVGRGRSSARAQGPVDQPAVQHLPRRADPARQAALLRERRQLLRSRLRRALDTGVPDTDLLRARAVRDLLQRRRAGARHPRSVQHEGGRLLHPGQSPRTRRAVPRVGAGEVQGGGTVEQRRSRRSRLRLCRRPRQHRPAHRRTDRPRTERREFPRNEYVELAASSE
jgi:hypothetical protein